MVPKLIHPVEIEILHLVDKSSIVFDNYYNEPEKKTNELYDENNKLVIKGQVHYYTYKNMQAKENGYDEIGDGYIIVDISYNGQIGFNDKIIKIAGLPVEFYLMDNSHPIITYNGKHYFMKINFQSRNKGI